MDKIIIIQSAVLLSASVVISVLLIKLKRLKETNNQLNIHDRNMNIAIREKDEEILSLNELLEERADSVRRMTFLYSEQKMKLIESEYQLEKYEKEIKLLKSKQINYVTTFRH